MHCGREHGHHGPWGAGERRGGAGWGGMDFGSFGFWGGMGGGPGRGRGGPFRGGRMFGQGDLKYIILQLLEERPRHGYDIIKELEERFRGAYSPSPGTVYPTLSMLEDLGYATARTEDGKKVYEITDAGRAYLAENRGTVDDIFQRIASFGSTFFGGPMSDVHHAFKDVGLAFKDVAQAVYASSRRAADPEQRERVQQVAARLRALRDELERAAREVDALWRGTPPAGGASGGAPGGGTPSDTMPPGGAGI